MLHLQHLDEVFADARFVMTHRDPTEAINSVATIYADVISNFTGNIDYQYIGNINAHTWETAINCAIAFRENGANDRFYDARLKAMHEDLVGQVKGSYKCLGESVTAEFQANMEHRWKDNAANREPGKHLAPPLPGLNLDEVRPLFAGYIRRVEVWTDNQ